MHQLRIGDYKVKINPFLERDQHPLPKPEEIYGIAAVLNLVYNDGSSRAIGYVSRTLNESEMKYPQIQREDLSIVYCFFWSKKVLSLSLW